MRAQEGMKGKLVQRVAESTACESIEDEDDSGTKDRLNTNDERRDN